MLQCGRFRSLWAMEFLLLLSCFSKQAATKAATYDTNYEVCNLDFSLDKTFNHSTGSFNSIGRYDTPYDLSTHNIEQLYLVFDSEITLNDGASISTIANGIGQIELCSDGKPDTEEASIGLSAVDWKEGKHTYYVPLASKIGGLKTNHLNYMRTYLTRIPTDMVGSIHWTINNVRIIDYTLMTNVLYKSFEHRTMCGYQGWFTAPGDGDNQRGWTHYGSSSAGKFAPGYACVDFWPDMAEYTKKYDTPFQYPDGTTAQIFSASDYETVNLHFKWMKQYGIDGAVVQRFKSAVEATNRGDSHSLKVLENCLRAAKENGVAVMVEYDLSGFAKNSDAQVIIDDWNMLCEKFGLNDPTRCPQYLWEKDKPLVGLYALGMRKGTEDNYATPEQYIQMMEGFVGREGKKGAVSILAAPGYDWRTSDGTGNNAAQTYQEWANVYARCAVIAPWSVGKYRDQSGIDSRIGQTVKGDLEWCNSHGVLYAPVAYPSFSWRNMQTQWKKDANGNITGYDLSDNNQYDAIPRQGGKFLWYQLASFKEAGCQSMFIAMFDEIDEGTAIFKCAHKDKTPVNTNKFVPDGKFVSYEDGVDSGYYMYLVGKMSQALKGIGEAIDKNTLPVMSVKDVDLPTKNITSVDDGKPIGALGPNPFITSIYTADPSAHVWKDGRLYVYPSHDVEPANGCANMDRYHVFSTDDMVNWKDHGEILNSSQVEWGRSEGGFMWAPDCAYANGKYYFYFPHPSGKSDWNSTWKVGVAVSDYPDRDFKVVGYIPNLGDAKAMIDPCVFVDDDGSAYFYYGGGNRCVGAKLKDNMTEIDGTLQKMEGLSDFHEATWVHKYNGVYYLSYADNHYELGSDGKTKNGANRMLYATSSSPLGPWTYRGVLLESTGCDTSHGSVCQYKGEWFLFYHNKNLSGQGNLRSICVDRLYYNEDGSIQVVKQHKKSEITGIQGVEDDVENHDDKNKKGWYNLMGQRVTTPHHGVFIHHGKKVFVK